ncbi:hypothetical protein BDZ45DRAFT_747380 [Acephala macrosclerotiorum]|nr:hypothetical protein BDZ45DRAFT_747380 [Acephala macrosclerotiorum]
MFLLPPRNIQQVGKLALYLDASCDNPSPQEHVYRYCHQDCGVGNQSSGCLSSNRWHDGFNEFCFRDDEWDVFADIWKPGDQWRPGTNDKIAIGVRLGVSVPSIAIGLAAWLWLRKGNGGARHVRNMGWN